MQSGLYQSLVEKKLLIEHQEVDLSIGSREGVYKIIKPHTVDFVSYPYEWCFSALKDAALLTLKIQKIALDHGMILKDASAYNIQFLNGAPVLIDTLSFEKYSEGQLWPGYKQFCQHFFAPLALMSMRDIRLGQLLKIYTDGVPLDLASKLLGVFNFTKLALFLHIYIHSKGQRYFADKKIKTEQHRLSLTKLYAIIDGLERSIRAMRPFKQHTEWENYYDDTNYSGSALVHKKEILNDYINIIKPKDVWDLGANDGYFSRVVSDKHIPVVAFDIDPHAVERDYLQSKIDKDAFLLPLVFDLMNPSPNIGWANEERMSLVERGGADAVLALALIHHLAIANNVPLYRIGEFLSRVSRKNLIIEFVPKGDSQVERLLFTREDIFPEYTQQEFEKEFKKFFKIIDMRTIKDSSRTLYLMEKNKI
ncbi:MAG: SAM-dependent methyltransferase [Patescibacteria group bacterium]